ncbi:hypothetical protein HanPSC8_Chr17g0764011 [Helianthus annuus]|nr:hypothetical protein HanPSC8_Chr17g0764011 [Helianthus annuus]
MLVWKIVFFRSYVIFVPFAFSYGCQTSPATKRLDPIVRMMAAVSVSSSY